MKNSVHNKPQLQPIYLPISSHLFTDILVNIIFVVFKEVTNHNMPRKLLEKFVSDIRFFKFLLCGMCLCFDNYTCFSSFEAQNCVGNSSFK